MIDIKFLRENPDVVKENIKKKFQDSKLPLVDEVIELDAEVRKAQQEADNIRANRNKISKEIGALMSQGRKEEAEAKKAEVSANAVRLAELEEKENELRDKIKRNMMTIPNIIDSSVPLGKDDSENVEIQKYGLQPGQELALKKCGHRLSGQEEATLFLMPVPVRIKPTACAENMDMGMVGQV